MYEKSVFAKGTAASFGVVALVVVVVMASGTAYAAPLAGVGGFTIEADKITSETVLIYPGADDTSDREAYPMAVVEQRNVRIEGMRLTKEIPVSSIPGLSGDMQIVITASGTVKANKQILKFSKLHAESASFNGQVVDEHNSDDPTRSFDISSGEYDGRSMDIGSDGPAQTLENATINAHYLISSQISQPGLEFSTEYDSDGDGSYDDEGGSSGNNGTGNGGG